MQRAHEFLTSGDPPNALRWLQRAARLAKDDPTLSLMHASTLLTIDATEALALLQSLVGQHPHYCAGRIGLIAALSRLSRANEAATALTDMLTSLAPPQTDIFRPLADRVCADAGAPGWIGLDGAGTCYLQLGRARTSDLVELQFDGAAVRQVRVNPKRKTTRQLSPQDLRARHLVACCGGQPLLGSGLSPAIMMRVEGFATLSRKGDITGWAGCQPTKKRPQEYFFIELDWRTTESRFLSHRPRGKLEI